MTTRTFTHVHTSGRYDRPDKDFKAALNNYASKSTLLTITEVNAEHRENVIRSLVGWSSVTGDLGGMDDCAVAWKNSEWSLIYRETYLLTKDTYLRADKSHTSPAAAAFAVLKNKSNGFVLVVGSAHLASGVEGKGGFGKLPLRVAAWKSQQKGYRDRWNYLAKKYRSNGVLVTADTNLNIKWPWVRALFKTVQPGMTTVWGNGPFPKNGTLSNRIIDLSFIRGGIKALGLPKILPHDASSDHTPYMETFTLNK